MRPTDQATTTFEQDLATLKRTGYLLLPGALDPQTPGRRIGKQTHAEIEVRRWA